MRRAQTIALLLSMLTALPAVAQTVAFGGVKADTSAEVQVAADKLTVNQSTGQAEFSGNVRASQGQMILSAEKVVVQYAPGDMQRIQSLDATGNVTLVSGPDAAEAKQAIYEVGSGNVTLIGDVLLTQGGNVMAGERMLVNLADGTAEVTGRVRSVLTPANGGN